MTPRRAFYELRAFSPTRRGRYARVRSLTIQNEDPHTIAVEVWRLTHLANPYKVEVRDLSSRRGKLCPLISYEELLRRAGSKVATS